MEENSAHNTDDSQAELARLKSLVEELEQRNQDLEHFAYVASHDLQEPLRTIEGYLSLLHRHVTVPAGSEQEEYFTHLFAGLHRMQQLIRDLLEYSRAGRNFQRQSIKVLSMLEMVRYNLRQSMEAYPAEITVRQLPATIEGHRATITQLFQNLLGNALKFSQQGKTNHITIWGEENDTHWTFHFGDTGRGIPAKDHQRIFELFTRLQGRELGETGTGIGLALCKRIVETHGGRIWLESVPGEGSIFHFTLRKAD